MVRAFQDAGHNAISCDIIKSENSGTPLRWVQADILSLPSLERIVLEYKFDSIVHLVGLPSVDYCERNPQFSYLLNVASVQNSLEAMRVAGIDRIVFASSASVYGDSYLNPITELDVASPSTIYGHHKLIAEQAINAYSDSYGVGHAILRLFNVFGADPQTGKDVLSIFLRQAKDFKPITVKGPNKFRDFIHVDAAAQALLKATETRKNLLLNVGSGDKTTLRELAHLVKKSFPNLQIVEETSADDGTGLQADITRLRENLNLRSSNAEPKLREHIENFSRSLAMPGLELRA